MNFFRHSVESSTKTGSSSDGRPTSMTFADFFYQQSRWFMNCFFKAVSFLSHFSKESGRDATVSRIQIPRESVWFFFLPFFLFSQLVGVFF